MLRQSIAIHLRYNVWSQWLIYLDRMLANPAYPIVSGNGCVVVASDTCFENLLGVVEGLERDTRSQGGIDNGLCTGDDYKNVRHSL